MRILLLLLLLLPGLPLWAADETVEEPVAAAEDNGEPDAPLSEAEQAAAMAAEIAAAEAEATATSAGSLVEEPPVGNENFVPSVQISEDLSVSFPVDI